jgi:acylphosphatase
MLVARRFVVRGRVQGVGFRFFVEAAAYREGLGGWVQNLADGSVEVVVEGDREAVDRLARSLSHGPPRAKIDAVDVEPRAPLGLHGTFTIRTG